MSNDTQMHDLREDKPSSGWHLLWKIPLGFIAFCILAFILLFVFSSSFRNGFMGGLNGTNNTNNSSNINTTNTTDITPTTGNSTTSSWISYTPDSNQFTVQLPSYPLHKTQKDDSGNNYDSYTTSTDNENTGYFIDVYSVSSTNDVDTFLETTLDNMVQGVGNNAKITYREYSNIGSYRALNYAISYSSNMSMAGRILLDANTNTMYVLLDGYYNPSFDSNGLKEFLSSFQINTQ